MGIFNRRDKDGYDKKGYDKDGHARDGYDKKGYDKDGYARDGIDENGWNRDGIHWSTETKFNHEGWDRDGYDKDGHDKDGIDRDGHNIDGVDKDAVKQFQITSKFSKIISSFNSDFDAFVTVAYNEPTRIQSKSFFSHDDKTGIYSKTFESFSDKNMVHFHIEKAGKQYGTTWNKPKDTGRLQGDNFESGYTLIISFNKNDYELKKILIDKLSLMNFGCLPSEYTLD